MNRTFSEYEFEDMTESAPLNIKVGSKDDVELIFVWWGTDVQVSVFLEDILEDGSKQYIWFMDQNISYLILPDSDFPEEEFKDALTEDLDLVLGEIENKVVLENLYNIVIQKLNKEGNIYG